MCRSQLDAQQDMQECLDMHSVPAWSGCCSVLDYTQTSSPKQLTHMPLLLLLLLLLL
jgi:hypothetical protein